MLIVECVFLQRMAVQANPGAGWEGDFPLNLEDCSMKRNSSIDNLLASGMLNAGEGASLFLAHSLRCILLRFQSRNIAYVFRFWLTARVSVKSTWLDSTRTILRCLHVNRNLLVLAMDSLRGLRTENFRCRLLTMHLRLTVKLSIEAGKLKAERQKWSILILKRIQCLRD